MHCTIFSFAMMTCYATQIIFRTACRIMHFCSRIGHSYFYYYFSARQSTVIKAQSFWFTDIFWAFKSMARNYITLGIIDWLAISKDLQCNMSRIIKATRNRLLMHELMPSKGRKTRMYSGHSLSSFQLIP